MRYQSLNPLNQLFLYFKNFEDELHFLETISNKKLRFMSWKIFCFFTTIFPIIQIIYDEHNYIYLTVSGISFCFLLGFQYARYYICLLQCFAIQIMVQIFIGIYYSSQLSIVNNNNHVTIIAQIILCMLLLDSQIFIIEFTQALVFTAIQLIYINPFSAVLCVSQITIVLLILCLKYFFYRVVRQLYIFSQNFSKWEHIVDSVMPINYLITNFEVRTHNIQIYSQNRKVREMGIRNSDELKDWLEKLIIINDSKMINKRQITMKNHLLNRHNQLLKDAKNLNKIRDKINENQIVFAELEDETTYRFEMTPIFMAESPLLLIAFEDITQYQKSSKKKNEQLNLCSMIFDNLKSISCKLEQTLHTSLSQKIHPKLIEIQKISSYFINQLFTFVDVPRDIPLQTFKFKDVFSQIQSLFQCYHYQIEDNVNDLNVKSNILLMKYCLISLFSCFENSRHQVQITLKNICNKYIMFEIQLLGNYQVDLFKRMNLSSNDFSSRKQISIFQQFVQKISPQEIQISFNSEQNKTKIFLCMYINLEEKTYEKTQNWINFINKGQPILIQTPTKNEQPNLSEMLNGVNSINHSYITTLSQFFLNEKTTQNTQTTPKYRKISLQNNIRKFSKEYSRKRNASISLHSPKNEILEQYTRFNQIGAIENNLSEIKSIASASNIYDELKQSNNIQLANALNSNKKLKIQTDSQIPKHAFSNKFIKSDIENGLIVHSPKSNSPANQDFVDLLNNINKKQSKDEINMKNSYLSDSFKSQLVEHKNDLDIEGQQNRIKEFTLNRQQQQSKQFDQQNFQENNYNSNSNNNYIPPHFCQEQKNVQTVQLHNNNQNYQASINFDRQQYASTSSITYLSQKINDESIVFCNGVNSLSNSICQFDNSINYQFQNNNINFQDRNKFQSLSPSKLFQQQYQQQVQIM
ncbi:transmembrane protein, putative (macronuclear) [Tetrahymena thermophila SB210]|uniref:Transmembrane protein, putative n=1 Tax=Tetrahymena thermophila (strain SB210) TaxID=312017 RepID=I7M6W5_TETTS|nr:transmembrane protein, putative [Tetrahymena thermophila SB210]EAR87387.2 transmembrane protein, putative [Tetrahymena thermophila SB210]|eukprot:XP_001007632.2 transmembrane protein, putative [Tetrahymena thermophila SB210]